MSENVGTNEWCTDPTCPYQPQEHVHGPGYVRAEPTPEPEAAPPVPDPRDAEIAQLTAERDAALAALSPPTPDPTPTPPAP